jgi:hypothetical protein
VEHPDGIDRHFAEQEEAAAAEAFVPNTPPQQIVELEKLWWLSADVD